MEKGYKNIVILFTIIAVIVFLGFYPTYFALFPEFKGLVGLHHFHGIVMILWLLVLIIQPVLINKKKYQWHRFIGKISYILVPIIIISMVLVYKRAILNSLAENGIENTLTLSLLFMPLTDILPFAVFYLLAIIYRKKVNNHLRFMISTAVVVVGSGIVRIFSVGFGMGFLEAIYANAAVLALTFLGLIIYDLNHKQLSSNKSFIIAFLVFTIPNLLIVFIPKTDAWKNISDVILN